MAAPLSKRSLLLMKCVKRGVIPRTISSSATKNDESESAKTHFGFQSVNEEEKEEKGTLVTEDCKSLSLSLLFPIIANMLVHS